MSDTKKINDRIVHWGKEIRSWNIDWVTGIFPGEMAAFLGLCEVNNVKTIIESGRGEHAYSTQILGEYALRTGAGVVSLDYLPIQSKEFRDRMAKYQGHIKFLSGDTFDSLPGAFKGPGPFGLLLDGPKFFPANRLSLTAGVLWDVRAVSHHNCPLSSEHGKEFAEFFPGAFHYEELGLERDASWKEFKVWEARQTEKGEKGERTLEASTLAMAALSNGAHSKDRLKAASGGPIRYRPWWLYWKWLLAGRFGK